MCAMLNHMNIKKLMMAALVSIALILVIIIGASVYKFNFTNSDIYIIDSQVNANTTDSLVYKNLEYNFELTLLPSWSKYEVSTSTNHGATLITIRNINMWKGDGSYMDIPVLVYTREYYYDKANQDVNYGFAAPIPPTIRAENDKYILVTAPRYNFSYLTGFEDVERILSTLKSPIVN